MELCCSPHNCEAVNPDLLLASCQPSSKSNGIVTLLKACEVNEITDWSKQSIDEWIILLIHVFVDKLSMLGVHFEFIERCKQKRQRSYDKRRSEVRPKNKRKQFLVFNKLFILWHWDSVFIWKICKEKKMRKFDCLMLWILIILPWATESRTETTSSSEASSSSVMMMVMMVACKKYNM